MEDYTIKISKIEDCDNDDIFNPYMVIEFYNLTNDKIASYEIDINELSGNSNSFNSYTKLNKQARYILFNEFVNKLEEKKDTTLYFVIKNGERTIQVKNGIMSFIMSSMTMSCIFYVKIQNQLIEEFTKNKIIL